MVHACNPSTQEVGDRTIPSSRPAWAACDPVSKQQNNKSKKTLGYNGNASDNGQVAIMMQLENDRDRGSYFQAPLFLLRTTWQVLS